jgi:hypothetical protein
MSHRKKPRQLLTAQSPSRFRLKLSKEWKHGRTFHMCLQNNWIFSNHLDVTSSSNGPLLTTEYYSIESKGWIDHGVCEELPSDAVTIDGQVYRAEQIRRALNYGHQPLFSKIAKELEKASDESNDVQDHVELDCY